LNQSVAGAWRWRAASYAVFAICTLPAGVQARLARGAREET
jgi:hypothetical protein